MAILLSVILLLFIYFCRKLDFDEWAESGTNSKILILQPTYQSDVPLVIFLPFFLLVCVCVCVSKKANILFYFLVEIEGWQEKFTQ